MNRNVGWLLTTLVATAGPVAVISIRLIGAGAGEAPAQESASGTDELTDLLSMVASTKKLRGAWEESEDVWATVESVPDKPSDILPPLPISVEQDVPLKPPRLSLSAVLGTTQRGAAVLNNRIYWLGDDLGQGWVLDRVDHKSRTVTLRHETGATHRIEFVEDD